MSKKKRQPFEMSKVSPMTDNQKKAMQAYDHGNHLVLHGYAGTGKTYLSLYLALEEIITENSAFYDKVVILRSVVPSRDMGFLPGSALQKSAVYEAPYKQIVDELFGRGDGYEVLKMKKMLEFTTTSFLRGLTFNRSIVIVDEMQNMTFQELDTVMTRMGDNSKIIYCGDFRQTDLKKAEELSGLHKFMKILKTMNNIAYVEFDKEDIVRSGIVKDYIIKKTELEAV
jgi:phosphate starvation-inducible protein PhoH